MSEHFVGDPADDYSAETLEPVHEGEGKAEAGLWTRRLVLFLRVMAGVSMLKGLYHWSWLCGVGVGRDSCSRCIRSPGRRRRCSSR